LEQLPKLRTKSYCARAARSPVQELYFLHFADV
jgi:hypothetical protein